MEGLELISFQIISGVGAAKSKYIEAIHCAKAGNFDEAKVKIDEGKKLYNEGHNAHTELIQMEAGGEKIEFNILLMHAEDLLMSADTFSILAEEFIDVYKKIAEK